MILKFNIYVILAMILASIFNTAFASGQNKISDRMKHIIQAHTPLILGWTYQPEILNELKKRVIKNESIKEIKEIDRLWRKNKNNVFKKELLNNSISTFLKEKIINKDIYTEIFLCDSKGAIVGMFPTTTDYWQGDEDKFIKSYNSGRGLLYYGPLEYDLSSKSVSVQISVPVNDWNKTLGVLVVGIRNIL